MKLPESTARKRPYLHSAYLAKVSRALLGERPLAQAAVSSVELAPANKFMHPAPIFERGDLDRITGVGAGTTKEFELQHMIAGWREHKATTAHRMKNLLLIDGGLYAWRFKHGMSVGNGPLLSAGVATISQSGVLAQSWLGARYFGHWLLEDVMLGLLASRRGDALGAHRALTAQQSEYAQFFNYHLQELPRVAFIEDIEVLADSGLNDFHIDRLKKLRSLFSDKSLYPRHNGVFLMRGATGESRQLINEPEVAAFMVKRGFKVINPGTESMQTVRSAVANADVVVGVEGSQLSHGVLGVASGGAMLVLQPPFRFNNAFKERCDLLGVHYSFMVCQVAAGGFSADIDALGRLLDRVQKLVRGVAYETH